MIILKCCGGVDCVVLEKSLTKILVKTNHEYIVGLYYSYEGNFVSWSSGNYFNNLDEAILYFNK
jgi:hypothetical protein